MLNRTLTLDDQPTRIVGVLPQDFELPPWAAATCSFRSSYVIAELRGATRFLRTFARL